MTFDVIKAIDDMTKRFVEEYGPIHKQEMTQHEKHLTWVTPAYAKEVGLLCSDAAEGNSPYFGQEYNNFTFMIGYRIGLKERDQAYNEGYEDAMAEVRYKLNSLL